MGRLPHFSPPNRFLNGVGTRNIKDNSIEQGKDDMHDADKRISRDTYQEGEDEAGWRPHGPKPHLEEKSIDSSTSMTVPPTTTGGCPASTPELKSLFELSGVGQKNFEHMGLGGPPASTMVVLALGRGSGPSSEPDGHQLLDLVQPATVRSPLIPFRGPCM